MVKTVDNNLKKKYFTALGKVLEFHNNLFNWFLDYIKIKFQIVFDIDAL